MWGGDRGVKGEGPEFWPRDFHSVKQKLQHCPPSSFFPTALNTRDSQSDSRDMTGKVS